MKNLRFVLIAAFSLMLTATSCKKEKVEPAPATPAAPVVTMVPVTVTLALVEDLSTSSTIASPSVVFMDVNGNVDTVITVVPVLTVPGPLFGGPCGVTGTTPITYSTSIPDGSKFRMLIYSGPTKVLDYRINQNAYSNDSLFLGTSSSCFGNHNIVVSY